MTKVLLESNIRNSKTFPIPPKQVISSKIYSEFNGIEPDYTLFDAKFSNNICKAQGEKICYG